jgi:hypothetical protein
VTVEAGLLQALDVAAHTASRDRSRFACNRILLRGKDGAVIGTDGRQLLVHKGFPLPWPDERLLPALPVFGCRELSQEAGIRLGLVDDMVTLEVGPWLLALQTDRSASYPNVDKVILAAGACSTRLHLAAEDVKVLLQALPHLPAQDDPYRPVTVDLTGTLSVRARGEKGPVEEVTLPRSHREGPALQVVMDRRYLVRALRLCFTEVHISTATQPLLCKDARRTYVWMPLSDAVPVPPARRRAIHAHPDNPRRAPAMPTNEPRGNDAPRNGSAAQGEPCDPVLEAEELRGQLQSALARTSRLIATLKQQRRESRAVRAAMASLRRLQS